MVEVKGLPQFSSEIDAWLIAVEEFSAGVARGLAVDAFDVMLPISPQYSGDFVANWNVSVGDPDTSFTPLTANPHALPGAQFIAGDAEAQSEARSRNAGKADQFRLGETIFITNASKHDDYYAPLIEDGMIKFRPGNAGAVIDRTIQTMVSKARPLTNGEAEQLAVKKF